MISRNPLSFQTEEQRKHYIDFKFNNLFIFLSSNIQDINFRQERKVDFVVASNETHRNNILLNIVKILQKIQNIINNEIKDHAH